MDSQRIESGVRMILEGIGEDPRREGLLETPKRVARAYEELCGGYSVDPKKLMTVFSEKCDEMIVVKDIELFSLCEHHMLPFIGRAHVAYLTKSKVVGLSKIARVVETFARRLQIQERLTDQIATCIFKHLDPKGCAVMLECKHLCMVMRGVNKQNSTMVTSSMKGMFISNPELKSEFFSLIGK